MPSVELIDIHKRFGVIQALSGAALELRSGEVHALLGENGAGKTTLTKVLYGLVRPDAGRVVIDGESVSLGGPRDALSRGIALVPQHFMGIPSLSVAENLILGEEDASWLSDARVFGRARDILARHHLDVDPRQPASELGVSQQQRLEITRALERGASLLILDEPTAVLAPSEVADLFELLRVLRSTGCTIVFISHKLDEITELCDRVTVLRSGSTIGRREVVGASVEELFTWMLGETAPLVEERLPIQLNAEPALRITALRAEGLDEINLEVLRGEVVGIAGIDGNGQGELEEVLAGLRPIQSGECAVEAEPLVVLSGDRQKTGLVLDFSVEENLVLVDAVSGGKAPIFRRGWISAEERRKNAERAIDRFGIRAEPAAPARSLSGGNQQKLSVARALADTPGVLVAVNPCRGLDQAATAFVRNELLRAARAGAGVLLISTDLDEVRQLASRIYVSFRGRLSPLAAGAGNQEIGAAMLGAQ